MGVILLLTFVSQLLSGVMLCFSFSPEVMSVPIIRSEDDSDDLYADDFFWLHERGVDFIFLLMFLHIFRKLYINAPSVSQESAWKSGTLAFLLLHVVTFLGLVLCSTHLSEVTLSIAANMLHSAFMKYGKMYSWFFPNLELNYDTMVRMMNAHYVTAFLLFALALFHSVEMHNDWKNSGTYEAHKIELPWWSDVARAEVYYFLKFYAFMYLFAKVMIDLAEPVGIELFMWGDTGAVSDIRFLGVTPHWYFRAYMSWLVVCPHHYIGLAGLLLFMLSLYYQPTLKDYSDDDRLNIPLAKRSTSLTKVCSTVLFCMAIMYCASYLPHGKFYNRLGGNLATLASFTYILVYLTTDFSSWTNSMLYKLNKSMLVNIIRA